ncbi:MAG TPA: hypothetical protein VGF24_08785 [Vicinamibacterales bacterium]|jgi:hypothetical protein
MFQTRKTTGGDPVLDRNPKLKVSAKVASNRTAVLRKDSPAVAQTIRELAARVHAID